MGGGPSAPPAPADPNVAAEAEKKKARQMAAIYSKFEGRLGTGGTALAGTDRAALANIGVEVPGFSKSNPIDTAVLDNSTTGKATAPKIPIGDLISGKVKPAAPATETPEVKPLPTGSTSMFRAPLAGNTPAQDMEVANAQNKYNRSLAYYALRRKGKVV